MNAYERIRLANGQVVWARLYKHLGVLTGHVKGKMFGGSNAVREIYVEADGTAHVCQRPDGDCRKLPVEES